MSVIKSVRGGTLLTLLIAGLAACGDVSTAPSRLSPDAGPLMSSGSNPTSQSGKRTFVVRPGLAVDERFGDHFLRMPANVICEPASSGYHSSLWDAPCAPIQGPIEITATWSTINGRPVIAFSPDLRFVPSSDASRWVELTLKDSKGVDEDLYYAILWYDHSVNAWVDESVSDSTLEAHANKSGNMVTRRLKHFSEYLLESDFGSYNVTSGLVGGEW